MSTNTSKTTTLRYRSGAANVRELRDELSAVLAELADPASDLASSATDLGMAAGEFHGAVGSVEQEAKGFGDVIILITIFAPAANHAVRNVWDELIWPRLKSRLGADALGNPALDDRDDGDGDAEK